MTLLTSPGNSQQTPQPVNATPTAPPKFLQNFSHLKYAHSFVPPQLGPGRRPFYSTSKVPSNPTNFLTTQEAKVSSQPNYDEYSKSGYDKKVHRSSHYGSSEALGPNNQHGAHIVNESVTRRSAFQSVKLDPKSHKIILPPTLSFSSSISASSTSTCLSNLNSSSLSSSRSNEKLSHKVLSTQIIVPERHNNLNSTSHFETRLKSCNDSMLPPSGLAQNRAVKVKTSSVSSYVSGIKKSQSNDDELVRGHCIDPVVNSNRLGSANIVQQLVMNPRRCSNTVYLDEENAQRRASYLAYQNKSQAYQNKRSSHCYEREDDDDALVEILDLNYEEDDDIFVETADEEQPSANTCSEINVIKFLLFYL